MTYIDEGDVNAKEYVGWTRVLIILGVSSVIFMRCIGAGTLKIHGVRKVVARE